MLISKAPLKFLIICFVFNILVFFTAIIGFVVVATNLWLENSNEFQILMWFHTIFAFGGLILWIYCIYFFYKYDKYAKVGFKLLFFGGVYAPFYFYKVIWKQKRPLQNKINYEPVLGNTIHLELEEEHSDK